MNHFTLPFFRSMLCSAIPVLMLSACAKNEEEKTNAEAAMQLDSNVAYFDNTVRFTVITDGAIRMEYAPDGQFVDDPSFIATIRKYPLCEYELDEADIENGDSTVTITTPKMKLTYHKNSGPFTAQNLTIVSGDALKTHFTWHPGDVQQQNLGGTYRTLDRCDGSKMYVSYDPRDNSACDIPVEPGLLARDGWTLIDDSKGLLFDGDVNDLSDPELPWVKERSTAKDSLTTAQDYYFLAYGHDYKQALADYTTFAGRIPLPPRFVFGYWWSRYWSYSDAEMRQVVSNFEAYGIPLDVLVVDMDWHWTEAGKGGWTGYTWNDRLFPCPEKFLSFLKEKGLKITLNLHPADGVPAYEDKYAQLAEFMGRDPKSSETIKWQSSDHTFLRGWLDKMLLPLEHQGVDFWWLDWQQQLQDDSIPALSNTWWINYCVFDNQLRTQPDHRPMLYHRWGGLGNHRYQIGFSGDTYSTWESLDYQPYFNNMASNVGYGYWSHDLGGHMFRESGTTLDRELYTRWMQLGTYLPIMRSHSTKNANMQKEPWLLGAEFQMPVTASILERYRLAPYIYTCAREAYETSVSICRPLYYDCPEADEAYASEFRNEYMFGDDMLICPITAPRTDGVSTAHIWLPAGCDWYETATGTLLKGGQILDRRFLIDEYPVYVKAGAIIPTYECKPRNLADNDLPVTLAIYPSANVNATAQGAMYEDNGNDHDYAEHFAKTAFSQQINGQTQTITIAARQGKYEGMPARRAYSVKLFGVSIPAEVKVDGKVVTTTYDASQLAVLIDLGAIDPATEHTVVITYPEGTPELNDGLVGQFRRVRNTMTEMKFRDAGIIYFAGLGEMGSVSEAILYYPERFADLIRAFRTSYQQLPELLDKQNMKPEDKTWFLQNALY